MSKGIRRRRRARDGKHGGPVPVPTGALRPTRPAGATAAAGLDHFHTPCDATPNTPGTFDPSIGPEEGWLQFLDRTSTDCTVLYPTVGLAYGKVVYPEWAVA